MTAEPIAIVGSACLLPGAQTPTELWDNVVAGRDCVSSAPRGRWRLDERAIACAPSDDATTTRDKSWSDRGGYVEGFDERFDPRGFAIDAELVASLDPLFQWLIHAGRIATGERAKGERDRAAVIVGNLSFPSASLNAMAERHWLARSGLDDRALDRLGLRARGPLNRFTSGLPAQLLARALGFGGEAFALDAACASSLYAIKLACDRLRDHRADLVVAGGINKTDDLFIHVGFCALQAMSKTGQSRPFHRDADGLVPAEGVALLALKRLDDAVDAGDTIHAVIRGVGLANDGRGAGILAPSAQGQLSAMRRAYNESGVRPRDVSLFECHATGTRVGDATEIESLSTLLREDGIAHDAPVGSLKSNLGHLITAAGGAGVLKVIAAMKAQTRPPTIHCEDKNAALTGSPLRLIEKAEPWASDRARLAAVSAFGFGGNDAHAIVEEWRGPNEHRRHVRVGAETLPTIAIVAVALQTAVAIDAESFARVVVDGSSDARRSIADVEIDPRAVRFPPRDLQQALPQQLLV
ncbi:MAG: polyketide synthase, partial [Polyangiales bacterium]